MQHDENSAPHHKGWYSRGYLPHLDTSGIIQAITFRLADSMPSSRLEQWKEEAQNTNDPHLVLRKVAKWLDAGYGACHLADKRVARMVERTLLFSDGEKYRLLAWVIMPNHVHVMAEILKGSRLPDIVQTWKSYSARKANAILGRKGTFWQADYFDRYIRNKAHLARATLYIHENPAKAGLVEHPEDWPFSSAKLTWER
jgi:REP element-mobilizing transposase RayT